MRSTVLLICFAAAVGLFAAAESKSDEQGKDATPSKPDSSDKFIGKEAGQVRDDNGLKMKLVWCPPGIFTMENREVITEPAVEKENQPNDDDDVDPKDQPAPQPQQTENITPVKVFLTKGYWLGKYEVTQSEWKDVMKNEPWNGQVFTKEGTDFAAAYVNWDDAMQFCRKLTDRERLAGRLGDGWEYTLPTEAQWERSCRARSDTKYSFGDDPSELGEYAWFSDNAWTNRENYAHRVGQKKPNPWGLYDMHGNVWEWCRDYWAEKMPGGRDPEGTKENLTRVAERRTKVEAAEPDATGKGSSRVMRGPGWFNTAPHCGSAARAGRRSTHRDLDIGFRVALSSVR